MFSVCANQLHKLPHSIATSMRGARWTVSPLSASAQDSPAPCSVPHPRQAVHIPPCPPQRPRAGMARAGIVTRGQPVSRPRRAEHCHPQPQLQSCLSRNWVLGAEVQLPPPSVIWSWVLSGLGSSVFHLGRRPACLCPYRRPLQRLSCSRERLVRSLRVPRRAPE